jgi:hypothetical protein
MLQLENLHHKEARFGFALQHMARDKKIWKKVVFSDEKTLQCADQKL